ncbi:MAG: SCO family protein [Gammaproteobacteria bacterium]|nr:SCO family protein [Gammaproteobacteria bacterium]
MLLGKSCFGQLSRLRCARVLGAAYLVIIWPQPALAISPYGSFTGESNIDPEVMQIDEPDYLGAPVRKDLAMIDSDGASFVLGDMLDMPVILLLSYYSCGGSCPIMNTLLKQALEKMDRFKLGVDFRVLTVSFDRLDTANSMQQFIDENELAALNASGWRHAMLKNSGTDLDILTSSVGYKFFWSRADEVFLHPNALIFLTPQGRVARYIYGTSMEPDNIEKALIDADWGRISNSSNVIDLLTGVCYSYNFKEGKYTFNLSLIAGLAALIFGLSLIGLSALIYRKKRVYTGD